MLSGNGIQKLF